MPNLTPGDGQDVLARFKRAWERRDVDAVMALFQDDAEFRPGPVRAPADRRLAIREHWNPGRGSRRQRGVRRRAHLGERHDDPRELARRAHPAHDRGAQSDSVGS